MTLEASGRGLLLVPAPLGADRSGAKTPPGEKRAVAQRTAAGAPATCLAPGSQVVST